MSRLALLLLVAGAVLAHGGSVRQPGSGSVQTVVAPHGGDPDAPPGGAEGPGTAKEGASRSTWELWWAYNYEYLLAQRRLDVVTTRPAVRRGPGFNQYESWIERIEPVLRKAARDKNHTVRSAAYIALGKLAREEYWKLFRPNLDKRGEKWWDSRQAAIFSLALLGNTENRPLLKAIVGDKARKIPERSLALSGFMFDGSEASADALVWYLANKHSGMVAVPAAYARRAEDEFRRFSAHLLGFVETGDVDGPLRRASLGTNRRGEAVQSFAITALARRGDKSNIEGFFRTAYDREAHRAVRQSATIALGMLIDRADPDNVRRLGRLVRDRRQDNTQQHFAIMALGQIGGAQAIDLLRSMIRDRIFGSKDDRAFLYLALGLCGSKSREARDLLLARFNSVSTADEQAPLAIALGLVRETSAAPAIARAVGKGNLGARKPILAYGSIALGLLGDPRGKAAVRATFAKYADPFVRRSSALGMVLLERDAAVPRLLSVLRSTGNSANRSAIVAALADLHRPSEAIVKALIGVYEDDSMANFARARAISALGNFIDPRPIPASAMLTRNYNYMVRCAALDELASYL